jgi:hypothetical protein
MALEQGVRFTLRDGKKTIGTGVVTRVLADLTPDERAKLERGRTRREKEAFALRQQEVEEKFKDETAREKTN